MNLKNKKCNSVTFRFLRDDSKKDARWDMRKTSNLKISRILLVGNSKQVKKQERVCICSEFLIFGVHLDSIKHERLYKLKDSYFCKARLCPICQNRKSIAWKSRLHKAYPILHEKYPTVRYIHLTLTVKNCHVSELRKTLSHITQSFKRLNDRMVKNGTIVGFMRSVEVTREMEYCEICGNDTKKRSKCLNRDNHVYNENCHPHVHVLLAVPSSYFNGNYYLTKDDWSKIWKECLQFDYTPVVWVSIIKPKKDINSSEEALSLAVSEVAKYSVKVDDEFLNSVTKNKDGEKWLLELDRQIAGTRAIGLGGIFKEILKNDEPTDQEMIDAFEKDDNINGNAKEFLQYFYKNDYAAYVFKKLLNSKEEEDFNRYYNLKYQNIKQNMEYEKVRAENPSILSDVIAHKELVKRVRSMRFTIKDKSLNP